MIVIYLIEPTGTGNNSGRKTFAMVVAERDPSKHKLATNMNHIRQNQKENVCSPYFSAIASTSQPTKRKSDKVEIPRHVKHAAPKQQPLSPNKNRISSPIAALEELISSPLSVDNGRSRDQISFEEEEVFEEFDTPSSKNNVKKLKLSTERTPSPTQRLKQQIEINDNIKTEDDVCHDSDDDVEIIADSSMRSTDTITKSWWERFSFDKNKITQSQSPATSISIPSSPPAEERAHSTPFSSFSVASQPEESVIKSSSQRKLMNFAYRP